MTEKNLTEEITYAKEHRDELLKQHRNRYLLINGKELVGAFDSFTSAAEEGLRLFGADGNFLVFHLLENEPLNLVMGAIL